MALHTELKVYKAAYDLYGVVIDGMRNMPREAKPIVGARLRDDCLEVLQGISRANRARDKLPHLEALLDSVQLVEVQLRLSRDKNFISNTCYARCIRLSDAVARQTGAWRAKYIPPVASGSRP